MSDHPLIIRSSDLTVRIDRLGAELRSMRDGQGREVMTDADPRWWTGHAPLLFPFVGRSRGDAYRMNGRTYSMPQHGFARRVDFALEDHAPDRLLLRLEAEPAAAEVRKLVGEHLPELINGYKKIPDSLKHKEYAGKTPAQQLVDGLKTIDREIETMTGQIARGELDKLAVRGRYLEMRYDNTDTNGQVG